MILLLDIGNSFIKWAGCSDGQLQETGESLHAGESLHEVFVRSWGDLAVPRRVVAANVAGHAFATALEGWVKQHWQLEVDYVATGASAFGVTNAYPDPKRLGIDRWLAIIAAYQRAKGPVCVVDCGTALTVDVVADNGQHLGGLILPGLGMMRDSLLKGTEGIDYASLEEAGNSDTVPTLLANDTQGAVEAGSLYASIAFIERVVADLQREVGQSMQVMLTGGDAPDIEPLLALQLSCCPTLVLEGLALSVAEECAGLGGT
jgi:type III pantothenate kinase